MEVIHSPVTGHHRARSVTTFELRLAVCTLLSGILSGLRPLS